MSHTPLSSDPPPHPSHSTGSGVDPASDSHHLAEVKSPTEQRLEESRELDSFSTSDLLGLLNGHDQQAVAAVAAVRDELAALVERAATAVRAGGHIHYFGAGTSGRLAVLDAAELLPTFNISDDVVIAHIAGGAEALVRAVEAAEDSAADGGQAAAELTSADIAIGLAASGNTPYVTGALRAARERGAHAVLVSCNPHASGAAVADEHILLDTGPEVITGSTRLKAGTAEKLFLNSFSTAMMVRLGRTWSNLMVSVVATNAKLHRRTLRILAEATGLDENASRILLDSSEGDLKTAIVSHLGDVSPGAAVSLLQQHGGSVAAALAERAAPAHPSH